MGGRGAGFGGGGGGAAVTPQAQTQVAGLQYALPQAQQPYNTHSNGSADVRGVFQPGYTDNNNPALLKWQSQDDMKSDKYLRQIANKISYDANEESYTLQDGTKVDDQFGFYNGGYQRFVLSNNLNAPATVVDEGTFNSIVKQNGLQVLYRGETGQFQCDRLMYAPYYHSGVGSFGDGMYFSTGSADANNYASMKGGVSGRVMKMALSPTARCVTYDSIIAQMNSDPAVMSGYSNLANAGQPKYSNSGVAMYALKKGYNVITVGDWASALTRDALVICSKTYKPYEV